MHHKPYSAIGLKNEFSDLESSFVPIDLPDLEFQRFGSHDLPVADSALFPLTVMHRGNSLGVVLLPLHIEEQAKISFHHSMILVKQI